MADILSHPVVAMILMLGGLVLFHELGHFVVGRWCGVAVETFSIGFGANIFSRKIGQTTYQVSWLPLGGYVKFYGAVRNEDTPEDLKGILYHEASLLKRALIIFAGPLANFMLAFIIFWVMVMVGMEVPPPTVGDVIEGSRAQKAGVLPGDRFISIDSKPIKSWSDIERSISRSPEREIQVTVERDGAQTNLSIVPEAVEGVSLFGTKAKIGRAGIALGYPSAVVTVVDQESLLGKAGLQTGDRIEFYKNPTSGDQDKVKGFHDFLHLLKIWKKSNVASMDWTVQKMKVVQRSDGRAAEEKDGSPRIVTVNIAQWPEGDQATDRAYGHMLGVADSHLTVAAVAGETAKTLKAGDHLISWNGNKIRTVYHLQEMMMDNQKPTAQVEVNRGGSPLIQTVDLKGNDVQKAEGNIKIYTLDVTMLGMSSMPDPAVIQYKNPFVAAQAAVKEGYTQTVMMVSSFWAIISGQLPLKALGGPIMIAKVASDSAKAGFAAFFATMAVISINLGIVNLFPIPVLDGGQLVMLGAERLKGGPLGEQTVENFHKLGFVLVLCLIVLAMYNDLSRFWASMISSVMRTVN